MAEIQVVFPPKLNGSTDVPPVVFQWTELVTNQEIVNWHVVSQNQDVKKVKIEFQDPQKSPFFPGKPQSHVMEQVLQNDAPGGPPTKTTIVWGKAPEGNGQQVHKYTVYGLDQNGCVINETLVLDPEIVTDQPRP